MYDPAHSGGATRHALREHLRRLEAALAGNELELHEARRTGPGPGVELLVRTEKLLAEEIARVRADLA